MAFSPKTPNGTYWQVNLDTGVVKNGTSHSSLAAISNVISYTVAWKQNSDGSTQAQLYVVVYDTTGNQNIINQAPAVLPDGYTDFKGIKPHKYLRSAAGDVIDFLAGASSSSSESDAYTTGSSASFGADGDNILAGQFL